MFSKGRKATRLPSCKALLSDPQRGLIFPHPQGLPPLSASPSRFAAWGHGFAPRGQGFALPPAPRLPPHPTTTV